ncbi:MAG: ATP synthase F1 subunit gamma [Erysipelotrichaceae bacterium]|nr:ATP synthase F1 subunit gamma [Erysipelotrichaceae bacterium]
MGQSMQTIKRRIRSIQSTMKITNAMELVATSKLQKQKSKMEQNKEYSNYLYDTVSRILSVYGEQDHSYLKKRNFDKPLTIVFTGDTGLCGGYHANLFRYIEEHVKKEDPMMMIGQKGVVWANRNGYHLVKDYSSFDDITHAEANAIANDAMELYQNQEVSEIRIVFTEFVNSVSFEPRTMQLLPIVAQKQKLMKEVLFEPSPRAILDELIPMYIRCMTYSAFMRAKTSEHASRRMAMENATDNAQELTDGLLLQYNQARQAAITQEITEIVAGADAL